MSNLHMACGWPYQDMQKRDLEYYVNKGEFEEVEL